MEFKELIGVNTPSYPEAKNTKEAVEQFPVHIVETLCHMDKHYAASSAIANAYHEIKSKLTKDITDEEMEALKSKMNDAIDAHVAQIREYVALGYAFTW